VSLERFGVHHQPTRLVLTFNQAMDPTRTADRANYLVVGPGLGPVRFIPIAQATYNPATHSVTLFPQRPLKRLLSYAILAYARPVTGITGANGVLLNGNDNGIPGNNYVQQVPEPVPDTTAPRPCTSLWNSPMTDPELETLAKGKYLTLVRRGHWEYV
jgi:hypothetical protein